MGYLSDGDEEEEGLTDCCMAGPGDNTLWETEMSVIEMYTHTHTLPTNLWIYLSIKDILSDTEFHNPPQTLSIKPGLPSLMQTLSIKSRTSPVCVISLAGWHLSLTPFWFVRQVCVSPLKNKCVERVHVCMCAHVCQPLVAIGISLGFHSASVCVSIWGSVWHIAHCQRKKPSSWLDTTLC